MSLFAIDSTSITSKSSATPPQSPLLNSDKAVTNGYTKSVWSDDGSGSHSFRHMHLSKAGTDTPLPLPNAFQVFQSGLLHHLYSKSVEAKVWAIAVKGLSQANPPCYFPEYTVPGGTDYIYRDLSFWTSGFFPGSMYLLLERRMLYPKLSMIGTEPEPHHLHLKNLCNWWTENLHQNAFLKGTHDLGFMIMPWASRAWKLNSDARALQTIKTTAHTLFDRYDPKIRSIRSWDVCKTKTYSFHDPNSDYLVIIDNMMNLDLLFFVARETGNMAMREAAVQHARTSARAHVRADFSTTHLVVFDPATGAIKEKLTNQGFSHTSCWARGQAWAIAGFAETYQWTQLDEFLSVARSCADYFLKRLPPSGVAPWDFDAYAQATEPEKSSVPPDTSATMIAAYGMLLIHKALASRGEHSPYLYAALTMANVVASRHLNEPARYDARRSNMKTVEHGVLLVEDEIHAVVGRGDTILTGATINNYEFAPRRWANHGLVYADYYFLLFGNELLQMNLGSFLCA